MRLVSLADLPEEGVSHDPEIRKQVLLRGGDVPHLTALSRARFGPGQATTRHAHADMHEVFFVQEGTGAIRVEGAEHPLSPGVCVVVEPGEAHEVACTGPEELVLLYFGIAG